MDAEIKREVTTENLNPAENTAEEAHKTNQIDYVDMAVHSGVAPIEVRYSQINDCYSKKVIAYRSFTYVNSVIEGVIPPEKYCYATDSTEIGTELAKRNIVNAIKMIKRLGEAGRDIRFVTARCPAALAKKADLYEFVQAIMNEQDFHTPEKLCLEFPQSLLYEDKEQVRIGMLNMKLLKVMTMMTGCGADDCPVIPLLDIPVDSVLLAPAITALADSRSKSSHISSFVAFIKNLEINVYADGVNNDEQITSLLRYDCTGYIPSSGYEGATVHGRLRMTCDEAVAQKEESD